MKNWRSGLSNILVLVFLTGLAVLMITIFSSQSLRSAGSGSSPVPTAVGAQTSPLATPTTNVPPARIGKPVVLRSSGRLGQLNLTSDKLVNVAGEAGTILIDPTSGLTRTLATTGLINAHASSHWLVYEDRPSLNSVTQYSRIKIVDLNNGTVVILGNQGSQQQDPQISGDVVAWDESHNGKKTGIYAYDLASGNTIMVAAGEGMRGYPKIAGQWITYVQWPSESQTGWEGPLELHAYSLVTDEDWIVGLMPMTTDSLALTRYAIDGDKIAWVKNVADGQYELHLYDLTAKTDRQLAGTLPLPPSMLSLSARSGVVVYYDEARRSALDWFQPTPIPLSVVPPAKSQWGYDLSVVGDYLVWRVPHNRESSDGQIIVTKIMR
jgi:beta propeller repeat protein